MRRVRTFSIVAIAVIWGACGPRDPLDRVISAPTSGRLAAWRSHVASDYNVDTLKRVEQALQEIRLHVTGERELKRQMGESVPAGAETIDEAVRQRVDRHSLREVLQYGCELRMRRLAEELTALEDAMSKNAQLVTKPGDIESKHHLEGLQERQRGRVEKYRADLAATERELAPLLAKTGRHLIEPRSDAPDEMQLRIRKEAVVDQARKR
jgi:hypothetical protein